MKKVCPICDGTGELKIFLHGQKDVYFEKCSVCRGTGIINWIQKIKGDN